MQQPGRAVDVCLLLLAGVLQLLLLLLQMLLLVHQLLHKVLQSGDLILRCRQLQQQCTAKKCATRSSSSSAQKGDVWQGGCTGDQHVMMPAALCSCQCIRTQCCDRSHSRANLLRVQYANNAPQLSLVSQNTLVPA